MRYTFLGAVAVTATLFAGAQSAAAQQQLSISAGGTGGVYYPVAGGVAELINTRLDGYSATAVVTGASVENVGQIFSGDADFAISIADVLTDAHRGEGAFDGRPIPVRGVVAFYASPMQIVTLADRPIESLGDLPGTSFSVGAPGSGNENSTRAVFAANGMSFDDLGSIARLSFNETADAMRDGNVDAGLWGATAPTSSIMSLSASRDIRMISLSDAEITAINEQFPAYTPFTIAAGTYPFLDQPVNTVAASNGLFTHADQSDETVYNITKTIHENRDYLIAIHPSLNDMTLEYAVQGLSIPLHPGAIRFYEERGIEVPDHFRP